MPLLGRVPLMTSFLWLGRLWQAHKAINDAMKEVTTSEERNKLKKMLEGDAKWSTAKA